MALVTWLIEHRDLEKLAVKKYRLWHFSDRNFANAPRYHFGPFLPFWTGHAAPLYPSYFVRSLRFAATCGGRDRDCTGTDAGWFPLAPWGRIGLHVMAVPESLEYLASCGHFPAGVACGPFMSKFRQKAAVAAGSAARASATRSA